MKTAVSVLFLGVWLFAVVTSHKSQFVKEDEAFKQLHLQIDQTGHGASEEMGLQAFLHCLEQKNGHGDVVTCLSHFTEASSPPLYMTECIKTEFGHGCSEKFGQCLKALHKCLESKKPDSGTES